MHVFLENEMKVICKKSILGAGRGCKTDHRKETLESEDLVKKPGACAVIKVPVL